METATSLEHRTGALYSKVTFEPQALYKGNKKKLLTYDASLESLRSRGQIRHPRPQEVFSLLIANLENKLTAEQKSVADDMLNSYGEWLSATVERNRDQLTIYTDPEGLVWNGSTYVKQNFKYESKRDFSVKNIPSAQWIDLNRFGSDLVEFLYTRKVDQLPQAMREGDRRAQIYLPPDGTIWPVGRGDFGGFGVISYDFGGASRGVVPSRAKKSSSSDRKCGWEYDQLQSQALTKQQALELQVRGILSQFDKYVGQVNETEYLAKRYQAEKDLVEIALRKK